MFSSFIGFGLVMLSVSIVTSALLTGGVSVTRSRLRSLGPWAERRAAALALIIPPLFGIGVTVILGAHSYFALVSGTDHCMDHAHHLHLCWLHGARWATSPVAVGSLGFLLSFALVRAAGIVSTHARVRSTVSGLVSIGEAIEGSSRVFLVPHSERFAFTSGIIHPVILISQAAWDHLDPSEKQALLAHERAHIAHGDLWKRTALSLLGAFGSPVLARNALKIFESASERLCDSDASRIVGKPSTVASAILSLSTHKTKQPVFAPAVHAATCEVTDRIHALFSNGSNGKPGARLLVQFAIAATGVAIATGILLAGSLHHLLETILG